MEYCLIMSLIDGKPRISKLYKEDVNCWHECTLEGFEEELDQFVEDERY